MTRKSGSLCQQPLVWTLQIEYWISPLAIFREWVIFAVADELGCFPGLVAARVLFNS